ncbi:uncharacterized protein TNCT_450001 [Trichonephila clavata]|uniref:Uncharacterized protein n=1 Tax=Trichonephila clavata TaxID=2740835 RepID=A0A8X6H3V9_TRICU|nr:uncharacterized protein TNCT_450001 [Trichonephila clavata]
MDGWSFKKKLSSWQGLKENKMEGAHSHFITEDVKDKPASVKMDLEICELYYKAIEVLLSKEGYGNSIKDIRRFLLLFIHSNNSLSKKQKSLKKHLLFECRRLPFSKTSRRESISFKRVEVQKDDQNLFLGRWMRFGCHSYGQIGVHAKKRMDIRVSVVDTDKKWMTTCFTILQRLEHFSNATWKIDFAQADLTKPPSDSVQEMIKTADIVSMVMFLSEVKGVKSQRKILLTVRKLMQPGSILFFVDHSIPSLITALDCNSDEMSMYNLLYKTTSDLHTLDEAVLERVFRLYYDKFHLSQFCTHIKVTTRVWRRSSNIDARNTANWKSPKEKHAEMEKDLAKMEKNLSKSKILLQEARKEIQLLQKYRLESIKDWIIIFNNEKKKRWWNKKQIREIIRPEEDVIDAELEKKKSFVATPYKDIRIEENELKGLRSYLSKYKKVFNVTSDIEAKVELNRYKKYVRKFMKHLKQNYLIYSKHKKNDKSRRHLVVSETLFAHR